MRTSQYLLLTLKETPAEADIISHQMMLRAGMIRSLGTGLYTWLPLGLRVLRKVETIVRAELNRAGCLEMKMPSIQPGELWQKSGRFEKYGDELLKMHDRHGRQFCYAPTAEEVVTETIGSLVNSYKQLPLTVYQITNKFRDEIRPRFGLMRSREFLMKDAYSFHIDQASFADTYDKMFATYTTIFTRLGLNFRAVIADNGNIGGDKSHEFQVLAHTGEDEILYSDESDYAANVEIAEKKGLKAGDKSPDGKGRLKSMRGIEVGQIFHLGDIYSKTLNAVALNKTGKKIALQMGCYGIGISRVVAAAIEQHHDDKGIMWPNSIAPFQMALIPIGLHKSQKVTQAAEKLYQTLLAANIDVLFDDRHERPGVMFNEMDLIGIPHRIVIGERGLEKNCIEYKSRQKNETQDIALTEIINFLSAIFRQSGEKK